MWLSGFRIQLCHCCSGSGSVWEFVHAVGTVRKMTGCKTLEQSVYLKSQTFVEYHLCLRPETHFYLKIRVDILNLI